MASAVSRAASAGVNPQIPTGRSGVGSSVEVAPAYTVPALLTVYIDAAVPKGASVDALLEIRKDAASGWVTGALGFVGLTDADATDARTITSRLALTTALPAGWRWRWTRTFTGAGATASFVLALEQKLS